MVPGLPPPVINFCLDYCLGKSDEENSCSSSPSASSSRSSETHMFDRPSPRRGGARLQRGSLRGSSFDGVGAPHLDSTAVSTRKHAFNKSFDEDDESRFRFRGMGSSKHCFMAATPSSKTWSSPQDLSFDLEIK